MSEIIVVDEGDSVTLNGSTEQGVIQWYKGSQLLTNNSKTVIYTDYKMTENSTNITVTSFLELHNVGGDDTGNYSYQIMNEIGNSSIDFEIHVNLGMLHL